jgi:flagellar protein FlbD
MIRVHRLNGQETVVNAELIESVESHGQETVLTFTTGNKIVVREPVTEVMQLTIDYKKTVYAHAQERSITCPSHS